MCGFGEGQDTSLRLLIGSREASVNGRNAPLVCPRSDGRGDVFVPLQFLTDAFGAKVH